MNVKNKIYSFLVKQLQKTFDINFIYLKGIVDIYKDEKHIVHEEKLITNGALARIPLTFVSYCAHAGVPSNGQFGNVDRNTSSLLRFHQLGTGTNLPSPSDIALQSPIDGTWKETNQYFYYYYENDRTAHIMALAHITMPITTNIREYGIFGTSSPQNSNVLIDRAVFDPIPADAGDIITVKYSLQISV